MKTAAKSLTLALGLTVAGISGYLLYLLIKKDDDDDYLDTVSRFSRHKVLEIKVPKDIVRSLIGRNGNNIKTIQEQSNTKINFKDRLDAATDSKICVIRGTSEACLIAENLIQEFINNQPIIETEDIFVPQSCVGKIIGRSGDRINEIKNLSGAKMNVIDDDRTAPTRRIIIKGSKEQICLAKSMIEDIVDESLTSKQKIDNALAKREPRAPPKSPEIVRVDSPKCERISPVPGQPDAQFEIYVSAVVDPSRFWVQIVGPKATELDCLVEEMTEYYNKYENRNLHVLESVNKGDLVAAIFQYDSKWYRAEVLNIIENNKNEPQAELYYVDYGDTDILPCKEIFELRTDFLRLHFQAIECFLARVEPAGDTWSSDAVDKFEELVHAAQWKKLSAKINGYTVREKTRAKREGSPIPGVDLYDVSNDRDADIAEELVKHGLAVFKRNADLLTSNSSRTTSISNISVASSS